MLLQQAVDMGHRLGGLSGGQQAVDLGLLLGRDRRGRRRSAADGQRRDALLHVEQGREHG